MSIFKDSNTNSQVNLLNNRLREEEYLKELEESSAKFKELQQKKEKEQQKRKLESSRSMQNSNSEDEDESEGEGEGGAKGFLGGLLKKVLGASFLTSAGLLGGFGVVASLLVGIYRVHFDGEFEFKGIGGEYQTLSFKKANFTSFDKAGGVVLGGLTKENKLTKAYYTLYSDKSYYAIVEDSEKYEDINEAYKRENLLTPDELKEQYPDIVTDESRERMFQLSPDVLYSLDRYLHKNQFLYPQQFVKPVFYEQDEEEFALKQLTDEKGRLIAESQMFDNEGQPLKDSNGELKKTAGIWDYGVASVVRYKEYKTKERDVTTMSGVVLKYKGYENKNDSSDKKEVDEEVTETHIEKKTTAYVAPGYELEEKDPEEKEGDSVHVIDLAVTAGGTVKSNISEKWQEKAGTKETETKIYKFVEKEEKEVLVPGEQRKEIQIIEHKYEMEYTYEKYTEQFAPYYESDVDTSGISGSKYYRDYIKHYSNYIPVDVPKNINFSVLENEEVEGLFTDDDPNAYGFGYSQNQNSTEGALATEEEFNNAVFMGDSITVGFKSAKTIPDDRIFAKSGITVGKGSELFADSIIAKKPPVIVISYGTNDAGYGTDYFLKEFHNNYKKLIERFQKEIPGVKIYVNKIFPGSSTHSKTQTENIIVKNIPTYNNELAKIASETGVKMIDCTGINNLQSYYANGLHFNTSFYKVWLEEMKKQIVNGAPGSNINSNSSSNTTNTDSSSNSTSNVDNGTNTNLSNNTNPSTNTGSNISSGLTSSLEGVKMPQPREGEDRPLSEVLKFGKLKDGTEAQKGLKWFDLATKYGQMYGIDPYIICAIITSESKGDPNLATKDGYSGLMQLSNRYGRTGEKVTAYNHNEKRNETEVMNINRYLDPEYNIKLGTMLLAQNFRDSYGNVLLSMQGYNFGIYGSKYILLYYLSGGTLSGMPAGLVLTKEQSEQFKLYSSSNHVGWITALYPGDLSEESLQNNGHGYLDPNDGKHDATTWYASKKAGQPYYLKETVEYYAGDGMPWMMKEDGTIVTVEGGTASGYANGGSSAIGAFNSYMASNWQTILEKKKYLYPWSIELDEKLEREKKGDYNNPDLGELAIKQKQLFVSNLTDTDEDIILNMMFALNQGNYLSKYDYMGEAEWKAMYNQLLSSPTGQTWDDEWIGYNSEDIFDESLEELGTLFKEDSGINPVISKGYGTEYNIVSDNTESLSQFNETNFGLDITVPPDSELLSVSDGVIESINKKSQPKSRYGIYVRIKYNNETSMVVANLKEVDKNIKVGEKIKKGQVIGKTGGKCKSYKEEDLHIELLHKGDFINPEWLITRDMKGFKDPIAGNTGGGGLNPVGNMDATYLEGGMKIPLMLQTDERWAKSPYGIGNSKGNTIARNGCAPTSISMIASYFTETTITPADVANWAGTTYYSAGQGSTWNIFGASAKKWGYNSRQISNHDSKEILNELKAGHPIIASMGPGAFTSGGHYIVLRGVAENGEILVNDPASRERSEKSWSLSLIMGQSKAMWAFSK